MICHNCGTIDNSIEIPEITRVPTRLGICPSCNKDIFSIPTQRRNEKSQAHTVEIGEKREDILSKIYAQHEGGLKTEKRSQASDIDRNVLDEKGNIIYFLEIKERSNSLNAYKITKFPYAKIEEAKKLMKEYNLPVHIVLKFIDCWARINVEMDKEYKKGDAPFAPRYRSWQHNRPRQVPAMIEVSDLEILGWREECSDDLMRYLNSN